MLACLLWHEVVERWNAAQAAGEAPFPALQQAVDAVFDARIGDISGRGKLAADMREIWLMQPRFERRSGNTPRSLVEQPRYRAAYDFLRLRADAGEVPGELAEWWEDFALGDDDERVALLKAVREQQPPRRVVAPRPTAPKADEPASAGPGEMDEMGEAAAPRKRRRRRRKPAGAVGGDSLPEGLPIASPD
jgi:poly(A) polymerase